MKLTIKERLMATSIIAPLLLANDYETIKILVELKQSLSFTDQEHEDYGLVFTGDKADWKPEVNNLEKDISFGKDAFKIINNELKKLDVTKKLTQDSLSLYEKIVNFKLED